VLSASPLPDGERVRVRGARRLRFAKNLSISCG
jgi:hypothetical protein